MTFHLALRTLHLNRREKNHDIMMVLALSTKYFRTSYFQNCTFSEWTNQFLHIIGLENAKLDIFVPTQKPPLFLPPGVSENHPKGFFLLFFNRLGLKIWLQVN